MPFGGLGASERIRVILDLENAAAYVTGMRRSAEATVRFGDAQRKAALAQKRMTTNTFIQNQTLFTMRRLLFYTSLGLAGMGAEVIKLGFSYNNALQTTRIALRDVITPQKALNAEIDKLYTLAALSPFTFKDTVVAFRQMYGAFKPLGFSLDLTNKTMQSVMDSLAFVGKTSPAQFNRVAVQLQHLAFVGRPVGQVITNLGRDGLPIWAALHKELGLNDIQIQNIAKSGVTAKQVIQAFNKYVSETPGYIGAAARQTHSLTGAWQEFRDILSQASGRASAGIFSGLTNRLVGINVQLDKMVRGGKPITFMNLMKAINTSLTPGSNAVMIVFQTLVGILQEIVVEFKIFFAIISAIFWPLRLLHKQTQAVTVVFRVLGWILGILITLWAIELVLTKANAFWVEIYKARKWALIKVEKALNAVKELQLGLQGIERRNWKGNLISMTLARKAGLYLRDMYIRLNAVLEVYIAEMTTADLVTLGWIGAAIAAVLILVILYWKWKRFHDLVNKTVMWMYDHAWISAIFLQGFGPIGIAIAGLILLAKYLKDILNIMNAIINASKGIWHVAKRILHYTNYVAAPEVMGGLYLGKKIFGAQHGGIVPRLSNVLVGEHGPELLRLPGGSMVQPIGAGAGLGGFTITVMPQAIYLDGKKVGDSIAQAVVNKQARS